MRNWDSGDYLFRGLIFGFVITVAFFLCDALFSKQETVSGIIVDKQYKPESTSIGTGTNSKGEVITTTNTEPEEFLLMVKTTEGIKTVKCEPELYYAKEKGDELLFEIGKGYFTNLEWAKTGIK